jgi:molybdopterin converting factor small subunit
MIQIKLRAVLNVADVIGSRETSIELKQPVTAGEFLEELCRIYGRQFSDLVKDKRTSEFKPELVFMLNGKSIKLLKGFDTIINDQDDFFILQRLGGG